MTRRGCFPWDLAEKLTSKHHPQGATQFSSLPLLLSPLQGPSVVESSSKDSLLGSPPIGLKVKKAAGLRFTYNYCAVERTLES